MRCLEQKIAGTDTEFDRLVYQLYGMPDDERKIIEDAWWPPIFARLKGSGMARAELRAR